MFAKVCVAEVDPGVRQGERETDEEHTSPSVVWWTGPRAVSLKASQL